MMKKGKALLLAMGIMTVFTAALLALTALILGKTGNLPEMLLPILTTVIGCTAAFAGGYTVSALLKEKGMLCGMICGVAYSLCIVVIAILALQWQVTFAGIWKLAAAILSGGIGGILGVNKKRKVRF